MLPPEEWADWPDEKLLDLRMCQLGVSIEDSVLADRIAALQRELEDRGLIHFKPHFWLSDEWFSPDGVPGVAIPFYLAHPRLERLERAYMLEVEGGTPEWCMRILRHEAGHAIDNAYKLRQRRRRQQVFGPSYKAYPQFYDPKPYSKSFVLHLDSWYAQSHPDEDFAETFAVWMNPESDWRPRYEGWPALKKLEYMDALMKEIAQQEDARAHAPAGWIRCRRSRRRCAPTTNGSAATTACSTRTSTIATCGGSFRIGPSTSANMKAARFIARARKDVRRMVAGWTGEYQYTIDQVVEAMMKRANELNLRLAAPEDRAKLDFLVLLTVQTMNYLHSGRHRVAL